jgi:hypothetical protein
MCIYRTSAGHSRLSKTKKKKHTKSYVGLYIRWHKHQLLIQLSGTCANWVLRVPLGLVEVHVSTKRWPRHPMLKKIIIKKKKKNHLSGPMDMWF